MVSGQRSGVSQDKLQSPKLLIPQSGHWVHFSRAPGRDITGQECRYTQQNHYGQDDVFENCSQGKQAPVDLPPGAPDWLQKDHEYQLAAAEFYSLDYETAKKHFAQIAQDTESPWAETADYLVARTLIRQASSSCVRLPARA